MRQLKITPSITERGGLVERYLKDISPKKMITPDEEAELAMRILDGDEDAKNRLVEANLRFVVSVAKQYQGHGLELVDLINEGNMGLLKAAERFDPSRGFKFISYAVAWVRQQMLQALSENSRMVRLPLNQVALLNRLAHEMASFIQMEGREPSAEELSEITGIPLDKVRRALCLPSGHMSLDRPLDDGDDSGTLLDVRPDDGTPATDSVTDAESLHDEIEIVLSVLTPKEREIVTWSFGIGCGEVSMDEIGERLGLSRERVRQVRERAVRKLSRPSVKARLRQYL